MTAQHTPGPWFIWKELAMQVEGMDQDEINDELLGYPEFDVMAGNPKEVTRGRIVNARPIACLDIDDFDDDAELALANARLIAAAPELLDAAQHLLNCCDESDGAQYGTIGTKFIRVLFKDAIAKATGGAA